MGPGKARRLEGQKAVIDLPSTAQLVLKRIE